MKRNKLILGSLSIAAVATAVMVWNPTSDSNESLYTSNGLKSLEATTGGNEAQAWLNARMIDAETGEKISAEKLNQISRDFKFMPKSTSLEWIEQGPANIGGRTRAILIDHQNVNNMWAGGVSGGLWYSPSRADYWTNVTNFPGNVYISSMAQDKAGNIYVATGSSREAGSGNGLWMSPDKGATWSLVPGTASNNSIDEVVSSPNSDNIFFTVNNGLRKYVAGGSVETVSTGISGTPQALAMSFDGNVLVSSFGNGTGVSTDAGATWTDRSGNGDGEISKTGFSRIEYAISKSVAGQPHRIYAATTTSDNAGQWVSPDNGTTWYEHTGSSNSDPLDIYRNQGTYNSIISVNPINPKEAFIGGIDVWSWNEVIEAQAGNAPSGAWEQLSEWFLDPQAPKYVHADNHEMKWNSFDQLFLGNDGGIGVSTDQGESFYPANRGYNVTQFYGIAFDKNGAVMGGAQDNGTLYNDHTNSTYLDFVEVTGGDGFECEISFFNPNIMFTSIYYNDFNRSSDGGVTFTPFVPGIPLSSYNAVGTEASEHPFHSELVLAEYFDTNSKDSVIYVPVADYAAGATVLVPSAATGDTIEYVTPVALDFDDTVHFTTALTTIDYEVSNAAGTVYDLGELSFTPFVTASGAYPPVAGDSLLVEAPTGTDTVVVVTATPYNHYYGQNATTSEVINLGKDTIATNVPWDTITVQDPYQSWFVFSTSKNGGELWGTRDALRLSDATPQWVRIAENIGSASIDVEFSEDLNHMFIAAGSSIKRVDGLGSIYTSDPLFEEKTSLDEVVNNPGVLATTVTTINTGFGVEGIGIDHQNPDVLVAVQGQFNGSVAVCNNATSANPTTINVATPGPAIYDVIVDREDNQFIVAATSNGAMASTNGGSSWENCSGGAAGFEGTPVFEIRQNWRANDVNSRIGNRREGEIYAGTFGRGIFSSESVLSVDENDNNNNVATVEEAQLLIFPNPTIGNSTLAYELVSNEKVNVVIYNLAGKMVGSLSADGAKGNNVLDLGTGALPKGTYIVKLVAGNKTQSAKFIKM